MSAPTVSNTTIEYFDGFDDCSIAQLSRYWTSASINAITTGRNGSGGASMNNNAHALNMTLTSQVTRTVGFAFATNGLAPGANTVIVAFLDAGTTQVDVRLNTDGTLYVTRNGTYLSGSAVALSINTWYYIEFSATINNLTGSYTLKINGNVVASGSGVNTRNTANNSANGVRLSCGTNVTYTFDDFYSRADGIFCGDCRVETKLPNANGAVNNFTPLAATNFTEVADNPADDDTSYNASALINDTDLYAYPALTTAAGAVQAVMTCPVMKNDSAGSVQAVSQYRQAGNNYGGTPQTVGSTTYAAYPDIQGFDPSTGAAWTIAGVNSAQFGVKRTG